MSSTPSIDRLRAAHVTMAKLVTLDPCYLPIFERIEHELARAEEQQDAISRARAIVHAHRAKGARSSR